MNSRHAGHNIHIKANSESIIAWFDKFEKPTVEVSVKEPVIQRTEREV